MKARELLGSMYYKKKKIGDSFCTLLADEKGIWLLKNKQFMLVINTIHSYRQQVAIFKEKKKYLKGKSIT